MIREVLPGNLSINLSKIGPHIYFCKAENDDINKSIVASINEFAEKYKNINILQIDWKKQLLFDNLTSQAYMNTVFLYFQDEIKRTEVAPNRERIEEMFQECLKFYKKRLEISFNRQGTNIFCGNNNINHEVTEHNKIKNAHLKIIYLKQRKLKLVREWMKLSNINEIQSAMDENSELSEIIKNIKEKETKCKRQRVTKTKYKETLNPNNKLKNGMQINLKHNKSCIPKDKLNKYKFPYSKKVKINNFKEWFTNIEINNIVPSDFLDEESCQINSQISKGNKTKQK